MEAETDSELKGTRFLTAPDGARLAYVHVPAMPNCQRAGVMFCGGFRSDMTGTKAMALEAAARAEGRAFTRFDYFAHGQSDGEFRLGTIGRWREDALCVLRGVTHGPQILVGSSMGGWLATLAALAEPARVAALVLIAPALDFTEALMWAQFTPEQRAQIQRDGVLREPSLYSDQPYEYHYRLIDEGRAHLLLDGQIRLACPVRILQGQQDPDVPWQHALRCFDAFQGPDSQLTLIKDGDHRLSRPQDLDLLWRTIAALPL